MTTPEKVIRWLRDYKPTSCSYSVSAGLRVCNLRIDKQTDRFYTIGPGLPANIGSGDDDVTIEYAKIKLRKLYVGMRTIDRSFLSYQFYLEHIRDLPGCYIKSILEQDILGFIVIRLLALRGKWDSEKKDYISGYDDAVYECMKDGHDRSVQFKKSWDVLSKFRNGIIAHIDAGVGRFSEGIEDRILLSFDPDYAGGVTFIDKDARDAEGKVFFLGNTRLSDEIKHAIHDIMHPHTDSLRNIAWFMELKWRLAIAEWYRNNPQIAPPKRSSDANAERETERSD